MQKLTTYAMVLLPFLMLICDASALPPVKSHFPPSEFADVPIRNVLVSIFDKHLNHLAEPLLSEQPNVKYSVRMTWITSFYGDASLSINETSGHIYFCFKRKPSVAAPDAKSDFEKRGEFTDAQFATLVAAINDARFFALNNEQDVVATDGTFWLLEIFDGVRYHAVYRVGPFNTPVQSIGRLAASLAGVQISALE